MVLVLCMTLINGLRASCVQKCQHLFVELLRHACTQVLNNVVGNVWRSHPTHRPTKRIQNYLIMSFGVGLCDAYSPDWNDHKNNLAQSSLWSTNIIWVKAKYLLPTPHTKVNYNKKMKRQQVQILLSLSCRPGKHI